MRDMTNPNVLRTLFRHEAKRTPTEDLKALLSETQGLGLEALVDPVDAATILAAQAELRSRKEL